jgi:hypothetical protein
MKYILGLGTLIVGGALVSGACTQSDSKGNTNPSRNNNTATTSSGGASTVGGTGGYNTGGTGGYSTGGTAGYESTGGSAGEGGWNAGGEAGESSTGGSGGSGGDFCDGDDELDQRPDCDDLPYAAASCDTDPPLGVTVCEQYAENATDEAFQAMFDCLSELELNCSDEFPQIGGVNGCLADVPFDACESDLAVEKCEAFGCTGEDQIEQASCVALLSSFNDDGVQAVIDCSNDATQTPPSSPWGGSSDVVACQDAFIECFVGIR